MCVWRGKGQAGAGGKPLRSRSPPSPHGSLPSEGGGMTPWIGVGGGKEGRAGPCGRRRGSRHVGRGGGWEGGSAARGGRRGGGSTSSSSSRGGGGGWLQLSAPAAARPGRAVRRPPGCAGPVSASGEALRAPWC